MNAEMRMSNFSTNLYGLSIADTFLSLCCLTRIFSNYRPIEEPTPFLVLKIDTCAHYVLYFLK